MGLRLMPTTVMEDMVDTVLATAMEVTARGLLTLRPTPTTVTEDMVDTDWAMEDTAMAVLDTPMARGLLIPMPTTVTVELTPDTDMVDTDMVDLATAMASKCQRYGCYHDVYL